MLPIAGLVWRCRPKPVLLLALTRAHRSSLCLCGLGRAGIGATNSSRFVPLK
jgi:hypothetical protein